MSFRKLFFVAAAVAMMFALTGCPGGGNGVPRPYTAVVYPGGDVVTVQRGSTRQFSATVLPQGAVQDVRWDLVGEGLAGQGVAIDAVSGLLTVAATPTAAASFYVRATVVGHPAVVGTRAVSVPAVIVIPDPASVSITGPGVSPGAAAGQFVLSLEEGASVTLVSSVLPSTAPQGVTWALATNPGDIVGWAGDTRTVTGLVHGDGVATITATATGTAVSSTLTVTVTPPGYAELTNAIAAATSMIGAVTRSPDGMDVPPAQQWVTQAVYDAFRQAITAAQAVLDDEDADQDARDDAVEALAAAQAIFVAVRTAGVTPNVTLLNDAIGDAEDLLDETVVSALDGIDVPPAQQWVVQAAYDALYEAIGDASALIGLPTTSQVDIDDALADLDAAIAIFIAARTVGVTPNVAPLNTAIDAANSLLAYTVESAAGVGIFDGTYWATAPVRVAFQTAITNARNVADNPNTQQQVSTAIAALVAARTTFEGLRTAGTYIPARISITLREFLDASLVIEIDEEDVGVVNRADGVTFELVPCEEENGLDIEGQRWIQGTTQLGTGASVTLNAGQLVLGTNSLTLVVRIGGEYYSRTITFRAVDE